VATTEKTSSFLAGVKAEITEAYASAYDEMSVDFGKEVPIDCIGETMQKLQKKTWEIVEKRLKESFLNGKKAGGGNGKERKPPPAHDAPASPAANPFRR
jgi:hypothetical protein